MSFFSADKPDVGHQIAEKFKICETLYSGVRGAGSQENLNLNIIRQISFDEKF